MNPSAQKSPLTVALAQLRAPNFCSIYEGPEEHHAVASLKQSESLKERSVS
ncbi:MAG TPA: hypothetical protein VLB68_19625 [Pyrinomonadaceae bacterium]|nr:hypothetical protein [Pyrinomonadaceae bacterium]